MIVGRLAADNYRGSSLASWLRKQLFPPVYRNGVFFSHRHIRGVLNIEVAAEVGFAIGGPRHRPGFGRCRGHRDQTCGEAKAGDYR